MTGGYINAALASDDAARAGYDEALMLTQNGNLSEASSANVFLVRNGRLITPAASENILEGITRDAVMQLAAGGARDAGRGAHGGKDGSLHRR